MNRLLRSAVLAVCVLATACAGTKVALVDDTFGFSRRDAAHEMFLASSRAALAPAPGTDESSPSYRFFLELQLSNRDGASWELRREDFRLEVMPCGSETCPGVTLHVGVDATTLISVAPRTTASLRLPIVVASRTDNLRTLERFPIEISYLENGRPLMLRRLLIGEFDPGWQTARFASVMSGALLLVFLL